MIKIATPLADKDMVKLINKAISAIEKPINGVKASQKHILNNEKGVLVLTGDTSPMDLIIHLPVLCEENSSKYVFVESKKHLKGEFTCVWIPKEKENIKSLELYQTVVN